jgi:hypothetical protein
MLDPDEHVPSYPETLVTTFQSTWRNIEDLYLQQHRRENLKSCVERILLNKLQNNIVQKYY